MKNFVKIAGALVLGFSSVAFAATPCVVIPGSYMRTDVTNIDNQASDMIVLNVDGTGTYNQGNVLELFGSQGSFTPGVGAWTCGPNNTVVLTTIHYAVPTGDSLISDAYRITHQLQFSKTDLAHPVVLNRVWVDFPMPASLPTSILLDPNAGNVITTPLTAPRQFAAIRAFGSDLSR